MNRRIVVPASVLGLALCFALISLPARPTNARDARQATQEATVDPCNPKPQIPGIITADSLFVFTEPLNTSPQLLIIKRADVVDVFGRNANGIWVLVETNSGISGWIPSRFVTMDKKLFAKLDIVDTKGGASATPAASGTAAATGTAAAAPCAGVQGTVTADELLMRASPSTKAEQSGHVLKKGDAVEVVALNSSGVWFKVRAGSDIGWVPVAYVFVRPGALVNTPHDYTDAEVTLTPHP